MLREALEGLVDLDEDELGPQADLLGLARHLVRVQQQPRLVQNLLHLHDALSSKKAIVLWAKKNKKKLPLLSTFIPKVYMDSQ